VGLGLVISQLNVGLIWRLPFWISARAPLRGVRRLGGGRSPSSPVPTVRRHPVRLGPQTDSTPWRARKAETLPDSQAACRHLGARERNTAAEGCYAVEVVRQSTMLAPARRVCQRESPASPGHARACHTVARYRVGSRP